MKNKAAVPKATRSRKASPSGPATIEMVAAAAGVSQSTVSRILNGTAAVSDLKKRAVEEAIANLGFAPNPVARGLAGGRTLTIGVVTQAIDSPFYGAALRGIEDRLDPAGYSALFVSGHWDAAAESRSIDVLRARRVDGVIVLTGRVPDSVLKNCAKSLPTVVTGRVLKAAGLFSLNFDNFTGGLLATRHLIDLGHRRIAFISGDADHPDSIERLRGYREALATAGLAFDDRLVVPGSYHEESGLAAVSRLLDAKAKFTAIFAANDQMAFGAALGLQRRSMQVPHDVSLVGFDDLAMSTYTMPPLTSVRQPAYDIGRLSAEAMLELLAGSRPTVSVPPPVLVARESSAPPPRARR
jgi:LacI family transcriptional regulator